MNRLDIIAELLFREPEPREPSVDPDRSGSIYRVKGGRFDGRLHLVDSRSLEREVERLVSIWKAKKLEFIREQVVAKVEATKTRFIYRVAGGRFDGTEREIESSARQSADRLARAKGRAWGATLTFVREQGTTPARVGRRPNREAANHAVATTNARRK